MLKDILLAVGILLFFAGLAELLCRMDRASVRPPSSDEYLAEYRRMLDFERKMDRPNEFVVRELEQRILELELRGTQS
jgi:hypothetical protein